MLDISMVKAVIFDNDGVIVDSEPLSCGALRGLFLKKFDTDIGNDFSPVIGTSDTYAIQYYAGKHDIEIADVKELIDFKQQLYFESAETELKVFPGLVDLLTVLKKHYPLAVASSGSLEKIQFSLSQTGIEMYFHSLSSATEVVNGKPAPDLFLLAASKLEISPVHCLVVEDSVKGIEAGKAAGMQVVGFGSSFPKSQIIDAGADMYIRSYLELIPLVDI